MGARGMVTTRVERQPFVGPLSQGFLSPRSAWPFFTVKAGGWDHKAVHKSQPFVDVSVLNYSTALIAALSNLSVSPPLLFYLVINHLMSGLR